MVEKRKGSRRKTRRVVKPLSTLVFWEGGSGRHEADICDVGMGGCYINTNGEADVGQCVSVEIPTQTASERVIKISGTVVSQQRTFKGFALRFEALNEEQESLITRLIAQAREKDDRSS